MTERVKAEDVLKSALAFIDAPDGTPEQKARHKDLLRHSGELSPCEAVRVRGAASAARYSVG